MQVTYKGKPIRITVDFLMETSKAIRAWINTFRVLEDYDDQPRLIYPAKLSTVVKRERKIFLII